MRIEHCIYKELKCINKGYKWIKMCFFNGNAYCLLKKKRIGASSIAWNKGTFFGCLSFIFP